jgi:hypothetical protein
MAIESLSFRKQKVILQTKKILIIICGEKGDAKMLRLKTKRNTQSNHSNGSI